MAIETREDRAARIAKDAAEDTARIGHRPIVTFELRHVLLVRVVGEADPRGGPYVRADRGVCQQFIGAQVDGVIPVASRSLGGGGGARMELHELGSEEALRTFLLGLDCVEEPAK
jgi:hypothetical protein